MADLNELELIARDGTSQGERSMEALSPDYAPVDGRSAQDLLAFVRQYAREIRYFDLNNQPAGTWTAFLGSSDADLRLSDAAAFSQAPSQFTPGSNPELYRPHLVLFLTFLRLFQDAQTYLNGFGRRHLDFYYRQVLRMLNKPAIPDQVNLLLDLAAGVSAVQVPAGTALSAGPDSLGRELIYATDRSLVANRARIAQLSSLCLDRRFVGTAGARLEHLNDRKGAVFAMLSIALGDPNPRGLLLPDYPGGKTVDDALDGIRGLLQFAWSDLFLQFFDLRSLLKFEHQRDSADADAEWTQINQVLQKAGARRIPNFKLPSLTSRDFDGNLQLALGGKPDFAGLPEVKSLSDAYDHRTRSDVIDFIKQKLFMDPADFEAMMQIKLRIDAQWSEINRILQQAGSAKTPGFQLSSIPGFDPTNFSANLQAAVSPNFAKLLAITKLPGITDIKTYYAAVQQAEQYFFTPAEDLLVLLVTFQKSNPDPSEWDHVDRILAAAHEQKVYATRRGALQQKREKSGFTAMLQLALGQDPNQPGDPAALLQQLKPFVLRESDFAILQAASTGLPQNQDWPTIYGIVEVAQRNRERLPTPVAQRVDWLNLYPAPDATKELVLGFEASSNVPRWRTFGMVPDQPSPDNPPTSLLGWAISSPLLSMSEGSRTIVLTLGFEPAQFATPNDLGQFINLDPKLPYPIRFEISTKKGWKEVSLGSVKSDTYTKLTGFGGEPSDLMGIQWSVVFDLTTDPFAPPPAGEPGSGNPWPMFRLTLRQTYDADKKEYTISYPAIAGLLLVKAHVYVDVHGLKLLNIANDENTLDAKKPFLPFGNSPVAGGRFFVSHPELVTKKLDTVTFHLEWLGVPANFSTYYANYGLIDPKNPNPFKADVKFFDQRTDTTLLQDAPVFAASPPKTNDLTVPVSSKLPKGYSGLPNAEFPGDVLSWSRYFVWELKAPDFQHQAYPAVAAAKAVDLSVAIANKGNPTIDAGANKGNPTIDAGANKGNPTIDAGAYKVNPPYTPKLKSLLVDYTASLELGVGDAAAGSTDQMFHIHPFGYSYVAGDPGPDGFLFLPSYQNQGELYIGLQNVQAPQNLSILFQAAEGSANPDLTPPDIQWSVLNGDAWDDAGGRLVLSDTTRGLITTGILEFDLPAAQPSTRMPGNLYWIRAAAPGNPTAVCDAISLQAQAVSATLVDNNNAPDHYASPLPVGSIKKFKLPIAGIAGVRQPYTSRGGRAAEADSLFYTRVSERLRHKQRALSAWDYERLVLAQFPEVYKVKCIPASLARNPEAPGAVQVVVIPDIHNKMPFDPFEPKASAELLAQISDYLEARIPQWATLSVQNAHYVAVKVRLAVRFSAVGDENFYKQKLNDDLNRFLAPWAYQEGADIVIGGKIYANSIVDFVDRRSYVDFVTNIELFRSEDGENFTREVAPPVGDPLYFQGYCIAAGRPDAILVAAREHQIDVISDTGYSVQLLTGIGYMTLELDFVVA